MTGSVSYQGNNDEHNLARFLQAQEGDYERALSELRQGQKRSHWIWYIFPQLDGLGFSSTARHYAIKSVEEARAYLDHPILGSRLLKCAEAVYGVEGRSATQIMGSPDDLKLKSCATLFERVSPPNLTSHSIFKQLIQKYYQGERDDKTLALLGIDLEARPQRQED